MKKKVKSKKKKYKLSYQKIVVFLLIIIFVLIIYNIISNLNKENESIQTASLIDNEALKDIETSSYANVSRYIVYGTHLNLEGDIEINENTSIQNAGVVVKNVSGEEIAIDTDYTYDDNLLSFSTLKEINTGLDLESLEVTDYYILLKVEFANNEIKYYSLSNDTEYGDIDYYTLTRNNSNNKIDINFSRISNVPVLSLNITTVNELPEDVYDVVIDPGHGGADGGASSGDYIESDIVLDCAYELKVQLEELGLKVLVTREEDEIAEEFKGADIYGKNGRVTMANESHAKILVSLHLNSNESDFVSGGVEVYATPNSDLTLAKMFADNIVEIANTDYSQNESYKEEEGVYVRTIEVGQYNSSRFIFDSIAYLFIIREIGGIATGAYANGNNSVYSENIYRDSNVGVEGYLIELGYINVDEDLRNILRNRELYMKAITDSINDFYGLDYNN